MSTGHDKAHLLSAKSAQIRQAQANIDKLKSQIDALEKDLSDLVYLRACCLDAKDQFISSVNIFTDRFDTFQSIKTTTKSAVGYERKMEDVISGDTYTKCVNDMDGGLDALGLRINNLVLQIEAKEALLGSYRSSMSSLRHDYAHIQRSS